MIDYESHIDRQFAIHRQTIFKILATTTGVFQKLVLQDFWRHMENELVGVNKDAYWRTKNSHKLDNGRGLGQHMNK